MTQPFNPRELDGVADAPPDDLAAEARIARELEGIGGQTGGAFSADFVDRVMASVEAEPLPAPARAAGHALRHGAIGAFLASFADAWRVSTRSGFPVAVRAQALALVLVVVGLAAGSGVATAGALGFMQGEAGVPSPQPSTDVAPTDGNAAPSMPPRTEEPTTQPPASVEPVAPDEAPTEPARTPKPTGTAGNDHSGPGGGGSGDDNGGQRTPKPTKESGGSGGGDDDGGDDGDHSGPGGVGDDDEDETETPEPTETPDDDSGHGGDSEHGGGSGES
jgi:uncharacterized membrane protein YgcG